MVVGPQVFSGTKHQVQSTALEIWGRTDEVRRMKDAEQGGRMDNKDEVGRMKEEKGKEEG